MTAPRGVARLLAGLLLTLSGLVGVTGALPAAPAAAAYCTTAGGANVQVDFGDLGGGAQTRCGTSGTAEDAFRGAGFTLEYDRSSGLLCRVQSKPADRDCTDTDAYWALFVADGGAWVYASMGVNTQPVDPGDSVALVWQSSSSSTRQPSVAPGKPVAAKPTPKPTKKPTRKATAKPATKPSAKATVKPSATPTPSVSATATAAASPTESPSATPTKSASPTTGAATSTPTEPVASEPVASEEPADLDATPVADTDDGGLPGWVAPVVVVALVGAAGGIAVARRRKA